MSIAYGITAVLLALLLLASAAVKLARRPQRVVDGFISLGVPPEAPGPGRTPYAYAHHINPMATVAALAAYHESFQPSAGFEDPHAIIASLVFAADTDGAARDLAASFLVGQVRMRSGSPDALSRHRSRPRTSRTRRPSGSGRRTVCIVRCGARRSGCATR
jgi:hypothetical protein